MATVKIGDLELQATPVPVPLHFLRGPLPATTTSLYAAPPPPATANAGPAPKALTMRSSPAMTAIATTNVVPAMSLTPAVGPATAAANPPPMGLAVAAPGATPAAAGGARAAAAAAVDGDAPGVCCSAESERCAFGLGCVATAACQVVGLGFFIYGVWAATYTDCERSVSAHCIDRADGVRIVYGVAILTLGLLAAFYTAYRCCCPLRGKQWLDRNGCVFCGNCCRAAECEHPDTTLAYGGLPATPRVVDQRHAVATGAQELPVAMPASPKVLPVATAATVVVHFDQKVAATPRAGGTTPNALAPYRMV